MHWFRRTLTHVCKNSNVIVAKISIFHCQSCLCLFVALDIIYLPIYATLGLVVGMTKQMSDGKEADIVNC